MAVTVAPAGDGSDHVIAGCRGAPKRKTVFGIFRTEQHEAVGKLTWTTLVHGCVRGSNTWHSCRCPRYKA
jgi:hypothetical protein